MNANSSLINDTEVRPVSRPQDTGVVSGPRDTRLELGQRYQTEDGTFLAFRYADTFSYQGSVIRQ